MTIRLHSLCVKFHNIDLGGVAAYNLIVVTCLIIHKKEM